MGEGERSAFIAWYDGQKSGLFDNGRVLEKYCQDDVKVLRQACLFFRRELMHIGKIELFLVSITIASVCYKVLRKSYLQHATFGLMRNGSYTCNNN